MTSSQISSEKKMFLMSSQVKKSCQCQLRDKKHQYFSIVSLPTVSVNVDTLYKS
jgi:hypothetical protein